MSASKAAAFLAALSLAAAGCNRWGSKSEERKAPGAETLSTAVDPGDPRSFAEPGEDAPISEIAVDPVGQYVLAVSRKGRKIGGSQIRSGLWTWKYKLPHPPLLLTAHPVTGDGFLVWERDGQTQLVRFQPTHGDTLATVALGPHEPTAASFDVVGNQLYLAAEETLLCVDLGSNRMLAPRPVGPVTGLAVDARLGMAVLSNARGITLLDLTGSRPAAGLALEDAGEPAVDSDAGLVYLVSGRQIVEISLESRQIMRQIPFRPERDFRGGRIALAAACRRLYIASSDLVEVSLDDGRWESLLSLGSPRPPVIHAAALGILFSIQGGQVYAAYHQCEPEAAP